MTFDPKAGDLVYYDFLWPHEAKAGHVDGLKPDRPCFVVVASTAKADGSRMLALAGVSHTPPRPEDRAIDMPVKLGRHLGLDDTRSWIKTNTVNEIHCPRDRVPVGFGEAAAGTGQFVGGSLPQRMRAELIARVNEHAQRQTLVRIQREDAPPLQRFPPKTPTSEQSKKPKSDRPTLSLPTISDDNIRKPLSPEERRERSRNRPGRDRK